MVLPRIDGNDELIRLARKEEPRFISILLKNKECLMDAMSFGIDPNKHFWTEDCRFMFGLIWRYYNEYHSLLTRQNMDSVISIQDFSDEEKASKMQLWDEFYSKESSAEDYELLKQHLNDRYVQFQVVDKLKDKLPELMKATNNQCEIVKEIQTEMIKVDGVDTDPYCKTVDFNDALNESFDYIIKKRENPNEVAGIYCGIAELDNCYYGFMPGSYTVIAGTPNGGKTTLMFNMAFNMVRMGRHIVYVSLEKEYLPLTTRLLCLHALVNYNRIRHGGKGDKGISDHILDRLRKAKEDLQKNINPKFEIMQLPQGVSLSKIIAETEKIRLVKKVDVLFVDYLGVISFETNHTSRPDLDLADVSQRLQTYGRIHKIAVITAVQIKNESIKNIRDKNKKNDVSKDVDKKAMVKVNPEDLGGSQKIVADADNSIGVVLNGDQPATKMFCTITKARDSASLKVLTLDFDGRIGRVTDPILEAGQITSVDKILYNKSITEEQLNEADDLFDITKEKTTTTTTSTPIQKETKKEEVSTTTSTTTTPNKPEKKDDFLDDAKNKNVKSGNDKNKKDMHNILGFDLDE